MEQAENMANNFKKWLNTNNKKSRKTNNSVYKSSKAKKANSVQRTFKPAAISI